MASLLCVPSSHPLPLAKPNSRLQVQQKPNSLLSVSSVRSQATDESHKSIFPLFSRTRRAQTQLSSRSSTTATKISSVNSTSTEVVQTVEHACFLQMKEPQDGTREEYIKFFKDALNSLKCLPGVLYLSAGYVKETYSAPGPFNFLLHSRHASKKHRDGFVQHPLKFAFQVACCPDELCQDLMMLDYVHKHTEPLVHPKYGCALRYTFLKLKDGVDESSVGGIIENSFPGSAAPPTFGRLIKPVFSIPGTVHDALKGYNLGMHASFSSKAALDALGTPEATAKTLEKKLAGVLVDSKSVLVADYVIDEVYGGTW